MLSPACYSSRPALTRDQYKVQRGNYASLTDQDINAFEKIVGKTRILTGGDDVEAYNVDWLHSVRGMALPQSETFFKDI